MFSYLFILKNCFLKVHYRLFCSTWDVATAVFDGFDLNNCLRQKYFYKIGSWTQSNILSIDLRYAGILGLLLAENGHVTFISHWKCSNSKVAAINAEIFFLGSCLSTIIVGFVKVPKIKAFVKVTKSKLSSEFQASFEMPELFGLWLITNRNFLLEGHRWSDFRDIKIPTFFGQTEAAAFFRPIKIPNKKLEIWNPTFLKDL